LPHGKICPKNILIDDQLSIYLRPFHLDLIEANFHTFQNDNNHQKLKNNAYNDFKHKYKPEFWYSAPELLFRNVSMTEKEDYLMSTKSSIGTFRQPEYLSNEMSLDMWSLGCIFSELFLTLTPLFQAVDQTDQINKFIEVLFFLIPFSLLISCSFFIIFFGKSLSSKY